MCGSSSTDIIALSSANSATDAVGEVGWSAVYTLYSIGERMPPWGTILLIFSVFEKEEPNLTWKWRPVRKDLMSKKYVGGRKPFS